MPSAAKPPIFIKPRTALEYCSYTLWPFTSMAKAAAICKAGHEALSRSQSVRGLSTWVREVHQACPQPVAGQGSFALKLRLKECCKHVHTLQITRCRERQQHMI